MITGPVQKLIFAAVAITLLLPVVAVGTELPNEVDFLAKLDTPKYYYARGFAEPYDSLGNTITQAPFEFYWSDGSYVFDLRMEGGGPGVFIKGIEDTVWIYEFMGGMKVVAYRNQDFGWLSKIPFTATSVLSFFNIFPDGFSDVDTFYTGEGNIVIKRESGDVYTFDESTKQLRTISKGETAITCSEYILHKGVYWPQHAALNKGIFSNEAGIRIIASEYSFKKQKHRDFFSVALPANMKRSFDLRNSNQ